MLREPSDAQPWLINFATVWAQVSRDRRKQSGLATTIAAKKSDPLAAFDDAINPT
jgi:hypothetical protein